MVELTNPDHDARTVDELVNAALTESDEDLAWNAISALHCRGSCEVLQRARPLCRSMCPLERRLGADILGQLGVPERTFPRECNAILLGMLKTEKEAGVLHSVLVALSHQHCCEAVEAVATFASHPDSDVRHAVVLALSGQEQPIATDCLIRLSADPDDDVRDWATFALGSQCDIDTVELRAALAARLDDPHDEVRAEAVMGLARRKDQRAVSAIQKELASNCIGTLFIEAAELLEAAELPPQLAALRDWRDMDHELLELAIAACSRS